MFLARVRRNDARLEREEVRVLRVDARRDPVVVAGAKGFDAGEVLEHAAAGCVVERLVDLEVVRVPVDEDDLTAESLGSSAERVDVVRVGVIVVRVREVLFVVWVESG